MTSVIYDTDVRTITEIVSAVLNSSVSEIVCFRHKLDISDA